MKDISTTPKPLQSTYSLLVRSEEKQRNRFETAIYTLLVITGLLAITQFGHEAVTMPKHVMNASHVASAAAHT